MGLYVESGQFSIRNPTHFSRTFGTKTILTVVYAMCIHELSSTKRYFQNCLQFLLPNNIWYIRPEKKVQCFNSVKQLPAKNGFLVQDFIKTGYCIAIS